MVGVHWFCGWTNSTSHHLNKPGMIRFSNVNPQSTLWFQPWFDARRGFRATWFNRPAAWHLDRCFSFRGPAQRRRLGRAGARFSVRWSSLPEPLEDLHQREPHTVHAHWALKFPPPPPSPHILFASLAGENDQGTEMFLGFGSTLCPLREFQHPLKGTDIYIFSAPRMHSAGRESR